MTYILGLFLYIGWPVESGSGCISLVLNWQNLVTKAWMKDLYWHWYKRVFKTLSRLFNIYFSMYYRHFYKNDFGCKLRMYVYKCCIGQKTLNVREEMLYWLDELSMHVCKCCIGPKLSMCVCVQMLQWSKNSKYMCTDVALV